MIEEDREEIEIARGGESLPALEILTGRGFITGKSGSGKSFSTNVILEGLLELGHPFLIIDTDGEYWGLKEKYEVLHLGAGDQCDKIVDESDADTIVDVALDGQPVILDVSEYLRAEESARLIEAVITDLFRREKQEKQPFLLVAEEIHEYIPEQGGLGDVGQVLIQIAKRGRKHGLGILGISQRPAAVDKDFITQCDWIVWHKLTWKNDTDVVASILGRDAAAVVEEFEPGEAYLMADWTSDLRRIRFKMKETYDAGATPGMESSDPPPLKEIDPAILNRFDQPETIEEGDTSNDTDRTGAEQGTDSAATDSSSATDEGPPSESVSGQGGGKGTREQRAKSTPNYTGQQTDAEPVHFVVEFANLFLHMVMTIATKSLSILAGIYRKTRNFYTSLDDDVVLQGAGRRVRVNTNLVIGFGLLCVLLLMALLLIVIG